MFWFLLGLVLVENVLEPYQGRGGKVIFISTKEEELLYEYGSVMLDLSMRNRKPFVFINCAMTADGKIALPTGRQLKISGQEDFARVHRLRSEADAVVVGITTVLMDDPKLTVKEEFVKNPRQPLRVVMDSNLRTPLNAELLNPHADTLIATTERGIKENQETMVKIEELRNTRDKKIMVRAFGEEKVSPGKLVDYLVNLGHTKIFVEGGGTVMMSFLREGLVDEYTIFVGSLIVGGRKTPVPFMGEGFAAEHEVVRLEMKSVARMDDGVLLRYQVVRE